MDEVMVLKRGEGTCLVIVATTMRQSQYLSGPWTTYIGISGDSCVKCRVPGPRRPPGSEGKTQQSAFCTKFPGDIVHSLKLDNSVAILEVGTQPLSTEKKIFHLTFSLS